jgi:hypothetical protein
MLQCDYFTKHIILDHSTIFRPLGGLFKLLVQFYNKIHLFLLLITDRNVNLYPNCSRSNFHIKMTSIILFCCLQNGLYSSVSTTDELSIALFISSTTKDSYLIPIDKVLGLGIHGGFSTSWSYSICITTINPNEKWNSEWKTIANIFSHSLLPIRS